MTHHPIDPAQLSAIQAREHCWCDRYKAAGGGQCEPCQIRELKVALSRLQAERDEQQKLADVRLDMFQREHEQRLAAEAARDEAQRALADLKGSRR